MSGPLQTMHSPTESDAHNPMREVSSLGTVASGTRRRVFVVIRRASHGWSGEVWLIATQLGASGSDR